MTALGPVCLRRAYFRCSACEMGEYAADEALGLDGLLSVQARRLVCFFAAVGSFARASACLNEACGWTVSDETILDALKIPDVTDSADRLIELALRGGGPDNVTVVVADVVDNDFGPTQPIIAGAVSGDSDVHDHLTRPNTSAGRASARSSERGRPSTSTEEAASRARLASSRRPTSARGGSATMAPFSCGARRP